MIGGTVGEVVDSQHPKFKAGDQVPVMPLVDVVGKAAIVAPEQTAATCVKVGVVLGVTVIVIVATLLQTTSVGVNV